MSVSLSRRGWFPQSFHFIAAACLLGLAIALLPHSQLISVAAAALALIGIAAIFAEPALGLALALIVGPFQPLERISLGLPIGSGQVVLAITLLAYGFRWLATRQLPVASHRSPFLYALAAFIVVCLLTFFSARDFTDWANECIKWVQILIIASLVGNERDGRKRALLIGAILISAVGQAIYGIIQADVRGFGPREFRMLDSETGFRAYGTFEQPNPFGGYMGLTWPLAAAVALFTIYDLRFWIADWLRGRPVQSSIENSKSKILVGIVAAAVALLCLVALNASGSRGALIGAGAAAGVMALALLRHPWRWVGAALGFVLALLAFDLVNVPASLEAQLTQYGDAGSTFGIDVRNAHVTPITFSTIERLAHWQAAIRMMESSPWLGVGFGNYAAAYPEFRLLPWENALGHAHNYYLNIFAETGVLGFLAYLALWITIIAVTWPAARTHLNPQPSTLPAILIPLRGTRSGIRDNPFLAVGILGAFAHLAVHHVFDNLYVANMHLLIGVYLGLVIAADASAAQPDDACDRHAA